MNTVFAGVSCGFDYNAAERSDADSPGQENSGASRVFVEGHSSVRAFDIDLCAERHRLEHALKSGVAQSRSDHQGWFIRSAGNRKAPAVAFVVAFGWIDKAETQELSRSKLKAFGFLKVECDGAFGDFFP